MQKKKQQLFALALALWAFSSCSQDARDAEVSTTGGETVTFSLDAEVSVDDSDLRAIEYKLGKNAKNQLVPLPQFTDKQEVEVHTILKSSNGSAVAKTLKWRYDASKKKLVLKQDDGHSITVSGFNNDNATKWYISGLIGGALNGTKVEFMGTRVVKGVNGNAGDALGSMEVPYAFGWTELTINTKSAKEGSNSYKYAEVPKSKTVQFKPLGSMLAVKLGTNQRAGAYTFTPKGFVLSSNAWGDQGSFELSTTIPPTNPHTSLPIWSENPCTMYYTFASGEEPGAIAHNQTTAKTYYVWVMPHKTVPTGAADVRVMLKGTSSRPETATYKDYTKTYLTDYTPKSTGTQGKVVEGKVHKLTARAIQRVPLPIEFVTEYNLAGGEGLTATVRNSNPQPPGIRGSLRFADSHNNDGSGYYNGYKVLGLYDATHNPDSKNLQTEVDKIWGSDKYHIPPIEQWWGVFPSYEIGRRYFEPGAGKKLDALEYMFVGLGKDVFCQAYISDYSESFTLPNGGSFETDNAVYYAIRFKARTNDCSPVRATWDQDWGYDFIARGGGKSYTYPSAPDNSMKCAYRFTRVGRGGYSALNEMKPHDAYLMIDVVYLGEESNSISLATISNETWWTSKMLQKEVISRRFPMAGSLETSTYTWAPGSYGPYWSSSKRSNSLWKAQVTALGFYGIGSSFLHTAIPVRLFLRHVD